MQPLIFHVESHPDYPEFKQCVTFNVFPSRAYEVGYSFFNMCVLYLLPLLVVIVCYSLILIKVWKKMRETGAAQSSKNGGLSE